MFKTFNFWICALGFAIVYWGGNTLDVKDYLVVMAGCLVISWADGLGRFLGDE